MSKEEEIKKKPSLSWDLEDYKTIGDEPPACVILGNKEGEAMEEDEVEEWIREQIQCLSVLKEDHPKRFEELKQMYHSDLEYLLSLGKITKEEYEKLIEEKVFSFGQE